MRKSILMTLAAGILLVPLMASADEPTTAPAVGLSKTTTDNSAGAQSSKSASQSTTGEATEAPTTRPAKNWLDGNYMLFVMMGGIVLLYVWMGRGRKKQEKQRRELLAAIKKGDKITTIGGIVGTVIEVRDNEVTVKTDETNNVRMKFARWAIRDIGEPTKGDQPK